MASGAAGWANVGFCPASSLQRCAEAISSAARNDSWKYLEKYGDYHEGLNEANYNDHVLDCLYLSTLVLELSFLSTKAFN